MESRLISAIGEALGVDLQHDPTVKHFDRALLREEAELLLPEPIEGWFDLPEETLPPIRPWAPAKAREIFLQEFRRLTEPVVRPRRMFEPEAVLV